MRFSWPGGLVFFFCVLLFFFLQSTWVLRFMFLARVFFRIWFWCVSSNFFELAKPGHNHNHDLWLALARAGHGEQFSGNRPISAQLADCHECCGLWHPTLEEVHQLRFPGRKDQGLATNLWKTCTFILSSRENMLMLLWKSFLNLSLCNRERVRIVAEKLPPSRTNGRSVARNVARMVSLVQSSTMTLTVPGLQSRRGRSWFVLGTTPEPIESSVTLWTGTYWNKVHPMGCLGTTLF